jgi:hypothetical protein
LSVRPLYCEITPYHPCPIRGKDQRSLLRIHLN